MNTDKSDISITTKKNAIFNPPLASQKRLKFLYPYFIS
jgi:hypothetical protein